MLFPSFSTYRSIDVSRTSVVAAKYGKTSKSLMGIFKSRLVKGKITVPRLNQERKENLKNLGTSRIESNALHL